MDRVTRATERLNLAGRGLEIGPSYDPIVPKSSGARVETVDHAPRAELLEKYSSYGYSDELLGRIEEVDYVWQGGSLLDVVPDRGAYDFILAAHVIEHQVDLIRFLSDCETLLTDDGVLSLVVPDKRYTFDRFLPLSSIGEVLDNTEAGRRFHPPSALFDQLASACKLDGSVAWWLGRTGELSLQQRDFAPALKAAATARAQGEYVDAHRWRFTPESLAMLVDDLAELGKHRLEIVDLHQEQTYEFFVKLRKRAGAPGRRKGRLESFLAIEEEMALAFPSQALITENQRLRADLEAVSRSLSWRVTKPLRALKRLVRRSA